MSEPVKMRCAECGKPWRFDAASARSYVCPCGSQRCEGTVTLAAWPDGGAVAVDGVERNYDALFRVGQEETDG